MLKKRFLESDTKIILKQLSEKYWNVCVTLKFYKTKQFKKIENNKIKETRNLVGVSQYNIYIFFNNRRVQMI